MNNNKTHHENGHHHHIEGFLGDVEIEKLLTAEFNKSKRLKSRSPIQRREIEKWYKHGEEDKRVYGHNEPIGKGKITCDIAVARYMDWIARNVKAISSFTNPGTSYSDQNAFLFKEEGTNLYFATVAPFQNPDFRDINLTEPNDGLLVAIFMAMESPQFYASVNYTEQDLNKFVLKDTSGIYEIEAKFDDEPINGCTVIRNTFQSTPHIPSDNIMNVKPEKLKANNTIEQVYSWIGVALRPEFINQGDHLLEFKVNSINYRINAVIQISGMVGV